MTFTFSKRSLKNLVGVHPDLVKVMTAALDVSTVDFGIIEGVRTSARQHDLFLKGKSQLDDPPPPGKLRGRHLTGHAVDFMAYVDGVGTWEEKYYAEIADAVKLTAKHMNVQITWGGDWTTLKDFDHIELDRDAYPDEPPPLVA